MNPPVPIRFDFDIGLFAAFHGIELPIDGGGGHRQGGQQ